MKRAFLKIALSAGLLMALVLANAKEDVRQPHRANKNVANKTEAASCVASTSQFDLDINNVRARLLGGGDLWWNFSEPKYEVPKGDGTRPLTAIFAGSIWITGLDAGGNLKCAAQRYRDYGNDFWPGPLSSGTVNAATCSSFDRHFSVLGTNIGLAQAAYIRKGAGTVKGDIPNDVLAWPAKGNPFLATDASLIGQTYQINDNLAPFKDADNDGLYDPTKGDYPVIPCRNGEAKAFADQMIFWVFNDAGNIHTQTGGEPIGVQVNGLAFGFQSTDEINNMTFYKYEIVNKSSNKLFQTYVSQWVDPDLGCFNNDRVGCDVGRSLGFCYNGTTPDLDCQNEFGYGSQLPMVGMDFFEGPLSDSGSQLGLSSFVYFTNGASSDQSDPITAAQYRNYQTGFWADGTPFTYGGTGKGGTVATNFIFPGNPSDGSGWSECTVSQLQPNDRRWVQSSGPFTLQPGASQYVTIGVVFVRPAGNGVIGGVCPDVTKALGTADDKAQALFNTCFKLLDGPDAPTLNIRELSNELIINLVNDPASNNAGEGYNQVDGATAQAVYQYLNGHGDSTYKFQGYKLYQVSSATVSATDLSDDSKAKLYAEVDVKDSVSKIINFIKDATLGLYVPTTEVDGKNAGVTRSFDITTDLFATGTSAKLVNHKTYYYTAVAFAYNNYKAFDQNNPLAGGQLLPYLQGRNNFKIYSAIPHVPDPTNTGTELHTQWGAGVEVLRIEGQGNAGNNLQLTPETVAKILASDESFADTLTYQKKYDPLGFKVTDPVAIKEADFELRLVENPANPVGGNTSWVLEDLTNGGTIHSERNLDRPYEQEIMMNSIDYGFSLSLGTPPTVYTLPANYPVNNTPIKFVYGVDPSFSTIGYTDSTKPWLSFVKDDEGNLVTNWIRCGDYAANPKAGTGNNPLAGVFDDNWFFTGLTPPTSPPYIFSDSNQVFEGLANGTWAPYCLTANFSNKNPATGAPAYVYAPGFKWLYYGKQTPPQNTLDRLASVDIVITPDKSKWSQCMVLETGEDENLNAGNDLYPRSGYNANLKTKGALKGQIRMSYSKDWHDAGSRDYLQTVYNDTGRSWFPGYAINVETGERLNIAFGEASELYDQNGRDMLWDPTDLVFNPVAFPGQAISQIPYYGGKHFIYVMETRYDGCRAAQIKWLSTYDSISAAQGGTVPRSMAPYFRQLMWTSIPYLTPGYSFVSDGSNNPPYIPPAEATVKLRVQKPFNRLATFSTTGDSLPRYQFTTKGLGITTNNKELAKSALDNIKIVPNPYLAYSAYETSQNTNTVKVTNLPDNCTVTIYSLDGTLIRVLRRAINSDASSASKVDVSAGVEVSSVNTETSLDWDLKNDKSIPIASGIYLFHIDAPGIGQKTLKWFGAVRPADTSNY